MKINIRTRLLPHLFPLPTQYLDLMPVLRPPSSSPHLRRSFGDKPENQPGKVDIEGTRGFVPPFEGGMICGVEDVGRVGVLLVGKEFGGEGN